MYFKTLLLATGNRRKYEEFRELLPPSVVGELRFAPDIAPLCVEETGSTYATNAYLKAQAWMERAETPALADDSGIEVRALSWNPGVRSARVVEGSDADRNLWLLKQLEGQDDRRACFVAALALAVPGAGTFLCEGVCGGHVADSEVGRWGFGYDPLFIPDGYGVSFGELPPETKNKISHRALAVRALLDLLRR